MYASNTGPISCLLSSISIGLGSAYSYECAESLILLQRQFPEARLHYHENDEWARVHLDGMIVWLALSYDGGKSPLNNSIIYYIEVSFYNDSDGNMERFISHDIRRAIEEIHDIYENFYQKSRKTPRNDSQYKLSLC